MPIDLNIPDIPHGHGLSFKKGIADGLLEEDTNEGNYHETHGASYNRGKEVGENLRNLLAPLVAE